MRNDYSNRVFADRMSKIRTRLSYSASFNACHLWPEFLMVFAFFFNVFFKWHPGNVSLQAEAMASVSNKECTCRWPGDSDDCKRVSAKLYEHCQGKGVVWVPKTGRFPPQSLLSPGLFYLPQLYSMLSPAPRQVLGIHQRCPTHRDGARCYKINWLYLRGDFARAIKNVFTLAFCKAILEPPQCVSMINQLFSISPEQLNWSVGIF